MKLISMSSYTIKVCDESELYTSDIVHKLYKYANLLKQPLTLGMFVPCDLEGNVIKGKPTSPASDGEWIEWGDRRDSFIEAQERVLFKGFELKQVKPFSQTYNDLFLGNYETSIMERIKQKQTIQDLVGLHLELTPNAINQLK